MESLQLRTLITPTQSRVARALLAWSRQATAATARISANTLRDFEGGKTTPQPSTLRILTATYMDAGIVFLDATEALEASAALRAQEVREGDLFHSDRVGGR